MTPGFSKLLITEHVIPDQGADWVSTTLDMIMMVCFAGGERTRKHWEKMLGDAGFKITKIEACEPGTESLIEAELIEAKGEDNADIPANTVTGEQ